VHSAGYLDIAGLPIAQTLQARLGLPVAIDNDCGMALVAEMSLGAAQGCRDVVMFTIGTGIGGAVATYGDLMRGRSFAGQLGHVTVDTMGEACACGRRGCVETTSSGTALGRLVATAGLPSGTTADALLAAAQAGQQSARAILARAILEAWGPRPARRSPTRPKPRPGISARCGRRRWATMRASSARRSMRWGRCEPGPSVPSPPPREAPGVTRAAILVNGVPASGKSTVSRTISAALAVPLLALDTVKEALFAELGTGDRLHNRRFGRASYGAIWCRASSKCGATRQPI
jgi:glucokinase